MAAYRTGWLTKAANSSLAVDLAVDGPCFVTSLGGRMAWMA